MTICRLCEKTFKGSDRVGLCTPCDQDLRLEAIFIRERRMPKIDKDKFFWRENSRRPV